MIYDLILEGGGTRSVAFLGALQEFEARGHTHGRLLGASAGAITAAMLACGYTGQEAAAILYDQTLQQPTFARLLSESSHITSSDLRVGQLRRVLREFDIAAVPDFVEEHLDTLLLNLLLSSQLARPLLSFLELGYWYSDQQFLNWLASVFDAGSFQGRPRGFSAMTLQEFHAATQSELSVTVSDVTDARVLILNHRTAPYCPLLWAVRMSASVPLLWEAVTWQDAWGTYLERDISGHQIIDGEVFSPFPIELLISDLPQVTSWIGPKQTSNVLGFVLDTTIPVPGAPPPQADELVSAVEKLRPAAALAQMLDAVVRTRIKLTIQAVEDQIVRLPAKGYGMIEVQLSQARFAAIVEAARVAANHHFARRSSDAGQADNDTLALLSAPGTLQYVNDSAQQQLAYIGIVNNYYHVDTDGGAYVGGDVTTAGGDFTGRDSHPA